MEPVTRLKLESINKLVSLILEPCLVKERIHLVFQSIEPPSDFTILTPRNSVRDKPSIWVEGPCSDARIQKNFY